MATDPKSLMRTYIDEVIKNGRTELIDEIAHPDVVDGRISRYSLWLHADFGESVVFDTTNPNAVIDGRVNRSAMSTSPQAHDRVLREAVESRGGDFFGPVVNTTARLEAAAHGARCCWPTRCRSGRWGTANSRRCVWSAPLGQICLPPLQIWSDALTTYSKFARRLKTLAW